jgi:SAM-dependent methyltransferase
MLSSAVVGVLRKPYRFVRYRILWEAYSAAKLRSARTRLLHSDTLSDQEKMLLEKVSCRVHLNDRMYAISSDEEYLFAGLSALRCIESVLARSAGHNNVQSILDFACGYGRVVRFLKARFSAADITTSDIDPAALDFCRRAFSVKTIISNLDFTGLSISDTFDLIWCGSLVTHIDENDAARLLRFFHDHLSLRGVCIFTTHGTRAAKSMQTYGLTETAQQQVLSQFHEKGYGYADYAGRRGIGISIVSPECMLSIAQNAGEWTHIAFLEHGWDNLQDVYGLCV